MAPFVLHLSGPGWTETAPSDSPRCWLKGQTYLDGTPIGVYDLAGQLRAAPPSPQSLAASLTRLNGFYAWVTQADQELRAGVDHVRSRPLFYGQAGGRFFLADEAEWVRQQVGDQEMDPIAREEFQLAGYVTGADTLFPHVKQLQAGECLVASAGEGGIIRVETQRYYRFLHKEPQNYDEANLRVALDHVAVKSIQRLINYAGGRQIVVPLSGGYDSRLIVTLLKRLGYGNVLTFSYGITGNKEAEFSQEVATALGFKWTFVEYSNSLWARSWSTPEAKGYRDMAANHASLPHVQDWLAVKILCERGEIKSNAVVVPGHTGDFISGGHIPESAFKKSKLSYSHLLDALTEGHYSNSPKGHIVSCNGAILENRISDRIGSSYDGTNVEFANLYELWDWQERQSKYIVNSVRVYDYYHRDWWMPLWDLEFVRFWESVPLILRKKRHWFKRWIQQECAKYAELSPDEALLANASEVNAQNSLARKIYYSLPGSIKQFIREYAAFLRKRPSAEHLQSHFLAFGGLVPQYMLKDYVNQKYNIIGIYSDIYLKNHWNDIHGW